MTIRKAWSCAALLTSLALFARCNTRTPIGEVGADGGAPGGATGSAGVSGPGGARGTAGASGAGGGPGGARGTAGASGVGGPGTAGGPAGAGGSGEPGTAGGPAGAAGSGNAGTSGECPKQTPATDLFLAPTAVAYPNTALVTSLTAGDLNGDGADDIIVGGQDLPVPIPGSGGAGGGGFAGAGDNTAASVTVFLADKTNGFAPPASYAGQIQFSLALADLDGDKQLDLVSSGFGNGPTTRLNLGAGALGAATSYDVTDVGGRVATGDLDGDGKAELLVPSGGAEGGLIVLTSAGGVTYTQKTYDAGFSGSQVAAGQLDGLAGTDVVLGGSSGIHVLLNDGGSGRLAAALPAFGGPSYGIALVDVDGDSKLDIVSSAPGGMGVFINLGGGNFAVGRGLPMSGETSFGDLNGDGKADAVVFDEDCSTVSVYLNDGHGSFSAPSYVAGVAPGFIALGDVNGDKALDLVTATSTTVSVRLHRAP